MGKHESKKPAFPIHLFINIPAGGTAPRQEIRPLDGF